MPTDELYAAALTRIAGNLDFNSSKNATSPARAKCKVNIRNILGNGYMLFESISFTKVRASENKKKTVLKVAGFQVSSDQDN